MDDDDFFSLQSFEDWGEFDSFFSPKETILEDHNQSTQLHENSAALGTTVLSTEASDLKPCNPITFSSLQLLHKFKGCKKLAIQPCISVDDHQKLSTEEVLRVAGAQYINYSVSKDNYNHGMLSDPFSWGLTDEETEEVELAGLLLASAEKIGNRQFHRGSKLLAQCVNLSSDTGSPVQRIVYYFSQALQERIERAKGKWRDAIVTDVEETVLTPNAAILDAHKLLPFCQINMFSSVQAIVESVRLARKVHLIDLGIRTGITWTTLMQALAARQESPVEVFKITAVGTSNKQQIQDAGRMLTSFAQTMGFQFSFDVVMVSNMEDIEEDFFDIEKDEYVAVYAPFVLRTMLTSSDRLDSLMTVIRNLKPCIMIVAEAEGNHNSPLFFNRFIECLFYFSAFFDCLDTCMDRNSQNRMKIEALSFGEAIVNIVATEGAERIIRNVGIDVWRSFFRRFRMVEKGFSSSSTYQAKLIMEQFAHWSSGTTLDMNGKCIIVKWKGTPLLSVSAWKFV